MFASSADTRDHGRADCDADPDGEIHERCLVPERERRLEREHGVVDARAGHVEGRHHGVAGELVHDAAPPADFRGSPPVKGQDPVRQLLRRARRRERRVVANVGEHRGHEALAGRKDGGLGGFPFRFVGEPRQLEPEAQCRGLGVVSNSNHAGRLGIAEALTRAANAQRRHRLSVRPPPRRGSRPATSTAAGRRPRTARRARSSSGRASAAFPDGEEDPAFGDRERRLAQLGWRPLGALQQRRGLVRRATRDECLHRQRDRLREDQHGLGSGDSPAQLERIVEPLVRERDPHAGRGVVDDVLELVRRRRRRELRRPPPTCVRARRVPR